MIWCIHGFLGTSSDWAPFVEGFRNAGSTEVRAIDLFDRPIPPEPPARWAVRFVRSVERMGDTDPILVGYSLGARLALHALLEDPGRFRGAILISAGLGVEGEEARQLRRVADDAWAHRFEAEPWEDVIAAWNRQPVLAGSSEPGPREEMAFDRSALASALRWWSPAVQQPLADRLHALDLPILWIAGERDSNYVATGRQAVGALPQARLWIAPGAGHRVPWDVPAAFADEAGAFLRSLRAS